MPSVRLKCVLSQHKKCVSHLGHHKWRDPELIWCLWYTNTYMCVCVCDLFVFGPRIKFCALAQTWVVTHSLVSEKRIDWFTLWWFIMFVPRIEIQITMSTTNQQLGCPPPREMRSWWRRRRRRRCRHWRRPPWARSRHQPQGPGPPTLPPWARLWQYPLMDIYNWWLSI